MLKNLYFCECCRKKIDDTTEIHYIEDNSDRGFCSDKCIMDFYRPYLNWLEKEEGELRQKLNIENEDSYLEVTASQRYLKEGLERPNEVWILENDLDQKFYTHISKINFKNKTLYFILVCSYVDNEPSFVFYRMATAHIELADLYRREHPFREYQEKQELSSKIPSEVFENIEQKKSVMLAEMLSTRSMHDIPVEDFPNYEFYFEQTLEDPDEVFERTDEEDDEIHTYIKSFKLGDESFFYIVVGQVFNDEQKVLIPILGFPSVDKKVYPQYAIGERTVNKIKN